LLGFVQALVRTLAEENREKAPGSGIAELRKKKRVLCDVGSEHSSTALSALSGSLRSE